MQHEAQDQTSRGTLPSLNQTGEGFLLKFDLGPHVLAYLALPCPWFDLVPLSLLVLVLALCLSLALLLLLLSLPLLEQGAQMR